MGRKSALTEKQWDDVRKRMLDGEPQRAIAREYGISEAAIRKRLSAQCVQIKTVANQLVEAETNFRALPISSQIQARTLADRLKSISENLADAAHYGALTAHRLSGIANGKVQEIDDADPLSESSIESLKGIAKLTQMANASSEIGINLLRANKETIDNLNRGPGPAREMSDAELLAIVAGG